MTKDERKKLKQGTFKGWELVQSTTRLCAMNLMLHGIGGDDSDLDEFVKLFSPANRNQRNATWTEEKQTGRWRAYDYKELIARDKASLDIFWLKDDSLEDSDNLPEPGILAAEIVEDLEAALEQFREIAADLGEEEVVVEL